MSFSMVVCYSLVQPHSNPVSSQLAIFNQAIIFLFFLLGLLLKVQTTDAGDAAVFQNAIIALSLAVPIGFVVFVYKARFLLCCVPPARIATGCVFDDLVG